MISFPFTSSGGDRKVYTKDFRMLFSKYFTNGVFDSGFAVTPATGMKVNISQGWCNINGVFGYSEETVEKQIETVSSETYFNIVLRLDDNKATRNIEIYVVKGTSTPPELTRNETVYELCIARIKVGANNQSITLSMIEDTRLNTDLCGIVANAVQTLNTDTFYNQLQGKLDEVIDIVDQALDETLAGNLQHQIDDVVGDLETTNETLTETNKYVNYKYSETEQWTGKYWVDSKKIYKKVLRSDDWATGNKNHGIQNMDTLIDVRGSLFLPNDGNRWQPVQRVVPDGLTTYSIGIGDITDTQYKIITGSAYNLDGCYGYLIFEYTKKE